MCRKNIWIRGEIMGKMGNPKSKLPSLSITSFFIKAYIFSHRRGSNYLFLVRTELWYKYSIQVVTYTFYRFAFFAMRYNTG